MNSCKILTRNEVSACRLGYFSEEAIIVDRDGASLEGTSRTNYYPEEMTIRSKYFKDLNSFISEVAQAKIQCQAGGDL